MTDLQQATIAAIVNVFETGRLGGDYGAVAVLKGDKGHLSYGRSQVTLGSGNLFKLVDEYCQEPGATFANELRPHLPRFQQRDVTVDTDSVIRALLARAGREDPVMRATQDRFFATNFLSPASHEAEALGITAPLGHAVVYDSHVQGGWSILKRRVGSVDARGVQDWVRRYIDIRRGWLLSLSPPLPTTVYRMDALGALVEQGRWNLELPLSVRGVVIMTDLLPVSGNQASTSRVLRLTTPYLRGDDVKAVQAALASHGRQVMEDGVYGPFTHALAKAWQAEKGLAEDGVGPSTRRSLGL